MTQEFILKIEESFTTLIEHNGHYSIDDVLVNKIWSKDPEKEQIIETVNKILNLFNSSSPEKQDELYKPK